MTGERILRNFSFLCAALMLRGGNIRKPQSSITFFLYTLYKVNSIQTHYKGMFSFLVCSAEFHALLGKAIYVPKEDLLGDIPNGISFFANAPDDCMRKIDLATTIKDQSFYKNTGEFYKSIATETNLEAKYEGHFTLGASLDVTTKSVSGSKRKVSGTSLNLATKAYEQQFKPNCLYEVEKHSRVLQDFANLKAKVASPWYKSSWRDYQRYATHCSILSAGAEKAR